MTYVIFSNEDGTATGCCPKSTSHLHVETTDKIVHEFEAADWDSAMQVYNDYYGHGPYVPMKD